MEALSKRQEYVRDQALCRQQGRRSMSVLDALPVLPAVMSSKGLATA